MIYLQNYYISIEENLYSIYILTILNKVAVSEFPCPLTFWCFG